MMNQKKLLVLLCGLQTMLLVLVAVVYVNHFISLPAMIAFLCGISLITLALLLVIRKKMGGFE